MARVKVPQADGQIHHFDGANRAVYEVKDGVIEVDEAHLGDVLRNIEGSALAPEAPAKKEN